jgi:hypothetical protein
MHAMRSTIAVIVVPAALLTLGACAPQVAPPEPAPAAGESGDEGVDGAVDLGSADLVGTWAEYWALQDGERAADTQRFVFLADGRFGWSAAAGAGLRAGRYSLDGATLVLQVERAEGAGGAPGELRLSIGPCPPNDEARALDAAYRCLGIDGDAFWLRGEPSEADQARYF